MTTWNRRTVLTGACGAALLLLAGLPVHAADDKGDPYAFVVDLTNAVLEEIRKDPKLHAAEPARVRALVDTYLLPAADFTMMTRMTVGPKWRQTSPEQKQRLEKGFQELLIRVYSGALTNVTDERCELRPARRQSAADEMVIRTLLKSSGKNDIGIDYRIYRNKAGAWKVVDVNVEGIWMVENYRSQFASVLSQDGINGLITMLETRTDELAAKNGSTSVGTK